MSTLAKFCQNYFRTYKGCCCLPFILYCCFGELDARGWRDGSSRGPGIQFPEARRQLTTIYITLVLEILIPLWEPGMHFGQSDLCELDLVNSTQYAEMFYIKLIFLLIWTSFNHLLRASGVMIIMLGQLTLPKSNVQIGLIYILIYFKIRHDSGKET